MQGEEEREYERERERMRCDTAISDERWGTMMSYTGNSTLHLLQRERFSFTSSPYHDFFLLIKLMIKGERVDIGVTGEDDGKDDHIRWMWRGRKFRPDQ